MHYLILNIYEYYPQDHRTRKAYHKLISLRNQFIFNQIGILNFIYEVERILYNEVPTNDLRYFKGPEGSYLLIIKLLIRSYTDKNALYRLKTDLLTVY